jgi:hypothetical protein
MKKFGIGPSGWRPFLGRSLVAATALLGFTSVHAVTIDTFADSFAKVEVITLGDSRCVQILDSANGNDDMVGLDRDVCISYDALATGIATGGVSAVVASNALTVSADTGTDASAYVIWDSDGGDGIVNTSGISPAANMVVNGETTLRVNAYADVVGSTIAITFYSSATQSSTYRFAINQARVLLDLEKYLSTPDSTGTGGAANLTRVTAIRLDVDNFQQSMDIAFRLLATPVEVSNFDVTSSGNGMEFSWDTGVEEDIAGFVTGRCDSVEGLVGCEGYKWVPALGNGSSYSSYVNTTGTGDCGMVVIDTAGELETDSDGAPVVYSVPCP